MPSTKAEASTMWDVEEECRAAIEAARSKSNAVRWLAFFLRLMATQKSLWHLIKKQTFFSVPIAPFSTTFSVLLSRLQHLRIEVSSE